MIKYWDNSNLREKGFISAYSSRGTQSILVRNVATGKETVVRYAGSWLILQHLHTESNANRRVALGCPSPKPARPQSLPSMPYKLQQGSVTSPNNERHQLKTKCSNAGAYGGGGRCLFKPHCFQLHITDHALEIFSEEFQKLAVPMLSSVRCFEQGDDSCSAPPR